LQKWPTPEAWQRLLGVHAQTVIDEAYQEIPRWIAAGRPDSLEYKCDIPIETPREKGLRRKSNVVRFTPAKQKILSRKERAELIEQLLDRGYDMQEIKRRVS
jgi:hypothetical protein